MDQDMMIYAISALAFLAVAGVGLALTGDKNEASKKRVKAIKSGQVSTAKSGGRNDVNAQRQKRTQEMLDGLRAQEEERKKSNAARDIRTKMAQAGMEPNVTGFWLFSLILGSVVGGLVYMSGADGLVISGMELKSQPIVVGLALFGGIFGLPRFLLAQKIKGRHSKMTAQFADAVDVIVRGVKSGLPLTECLRIISREGQAPLRGEFQQLTDALAMGTNMDRALQNLYKRVPLPEVNFFAIVLTIQSKSGGNLSEALGNLSAVIRSRRMMREKIKAMSSEAKASAMIIGSLPFVVGVMVYMSTPEYIMELFTKDMGHLILAMGALLMGTGIMTMRRMINFDI